MKGEELVEALAALFDDLAVRAPFGVTWLTDSRTLPAHVEVTPADHQPRTFTVSGATTDEAVVDLASAVQTWLSSQLQTPVPPCPRHGTALGPLLKGRTPEWGCPRGDFACRFGRYLISLWPPSMDDPQAAPMLARRLADVGLRYRSAGFGVSEGTATATVTLVAGQDEGLARATINPFETELHWAEPTVTERFTEATADGTFEGLRLRGGAHRMARLQGFLARPQEGDDADVLIGDTWVRIGPDHRIGGRGQPLLLDPRGAHLGDVGDFAVCGGGFRPSTGVRGERRPFFASEIRVRNR